MSENFKKTIDIYTQWVYNIITVREDLTSTKERSKAMAKKTKKSTKPEYKTYIVQGLIDLIVGTLLILIGKLVD